MSLKHLVREFRTDHKLFLITIVNGGRPIKVLERNRMRDYEVSFELGGAAWLLDAVEMALKDERNRQFFRKFRGSSYLLLLEVKYNKWGKFPQLVKFQNGVESKVIVPWEVRGRGWRDFQDCLGSLMGRRKGNKEPFLRTGQEISQSQKEGMKIGRAITDNMVKAEGEISTVKHNHSLPVPVRIVVWQQIEHWKNIVFKVIGEKLGGFIDVAKDTLNFDCMNYTRIPVKGGRNGFLAATLDFPRESDIRSTGAGTTAKVANYMLPNNGRSKFLGKRVQYGGTAEMLEKMGSKNFLSAFVGHNAYKGENITSQPNSGLIGNWPPAHLATPVTKKAQVFKDNIGPSRWEQGGGADGRSIRAQSEPSRAHNKWVTAGKYLKRLEPKQKEAFVKGRIQSWRNFMTERKVT
ncbi:hypothetical protein TorRG33x02_281000 [Trema orientale]|uniref:Uncharacterized protein n=1 Tax=Trema orientale TaxID=63057 RepID=A0A2P5CL94_TREOI|nr:hypothetical protein TorRG33x02_281000 [Trema orientale]